jgi:hypothetical protein
LEERSLVKAAWQFEKDHPRGGAASGAWSNQLTGAELSAETILAREAIQNSTDAELPGAKVRVDFTRYRLSPPDRDRLAETLHLQAGPLARLAHLGLPAGNSFRFRLADGSMLRVKYLRDVSETPYHRNSAMPLLSLL